MLGLPWVRITADCVNVWMSVNATKLWMRGTVLRTLLAIDRTKGLRASNIVEYAVAVIDVLRSA